MGGSGCVAPEIRPELHFAVQIDTTFRRLKSRVIHGFQRFALSFNRTVVMQHRNRAGRAPKLLVVLAEGMHRLPATAHEQIVEDTLVRPGQRPEFRGQG